VSAVFGLCRDQAARLADRPFPIGRPGRPPMQGANPGSLGEAKRGKGNTTAFPASLWRSSALNDVLARYQDFRNPD